MTDQPTPLNEQDIDWDWVCAFMRVRVRSLLGRGDSAVEDLAQEAALNLVRLVRQRPVRKPKVIASLIARAVVADEIRRRQRFRARIVDWDQNLSRIMELSTVSPSDWDDPLKMLWFLLVEYFRLRKASCLILAERYAELESWQEVADSLGQTHDQVRRAWSRCTRMFREDLRKNPGQYQDWLDGNA